MWKRSFGRWAALLASGTVLLQATSSCTETAIVINSISQVLTASGVLYLVSRVLE